MADQPMYSGDKGSVPMYYGGKTPMYYGGAGRNYGVKAYGGAYGGGAYGGGAYGGGAYGGYGYGGYGYGSYGYGSYGYGGYGGSYGGGKEPEESSFIGRITLTRVLRVISQRWLSIFVFLLVGLVVSFSVYRISPTIYQATSEFTMDMRRMTGGRGGDSVLANSMRDDGVSYVEIFNTRMSDWRSDKIVAKIVQQYRSSRPDSTATDEEIMGVLAGSELELVRNSRIITISLRSTSPALCADLANAYAESIEAFTDDENRARCDKAVSQIHGNVERQRRSVDKIAKQMMDFRTANKIDSLRANLETVEQARTKTTTDILDLESEESQLLEWEKMLSAVQKDPTSYGNLATGVPRAQEIANEFKAYQDADSDYQRLMLAFTESHPEVVSAKKMLDLSRQRFLDSASRALLTGRATLQATRNQLASLRQKREDLDAELRSISERIGLAESGIKQLESDYDVQNKVLESLYTNENQARIEAESNNEIVRVGRPATIPEKPILPNPLLIFGAGVALSLAFGVLFVLVVDNLEDTVVNLADIEGRLALKVLAVLPHVRRKNRAEVARTLVDDKYSQFAESVAGLRNLLDSPRYEALSHCILVISTQPGEGKTITSTSLAISYAQAGRKVLHVDFDLRRPRLAKIWELELDAEHSFSHVLQNAGESVPDFSELAHHVSVPGLDVIGSLAPDGVSPATIFGSSSVSAFFDWARANYDHILVDSPPFGVVGDVVSLSVLVDSVILMCCPDRTHFRPIQFCTRSLTEAGANILGAIVNDIEVSSAAAFSPHSGGHGYHKYGYGYGYGSGYGYRPRDPEDDDEASPQRKLADGASPADEDSREDEGEDLAPKGFADEE